MGDNRSYAALEWVIGEIGESLNQARQALEAYVDNTEDTTRIRFCLTHIHQVHGSLQMVEFYGAALLAEEMESLAKAVLNKSVRNETEAQEVLMRAILQLPIYLDQVKATRKDNPAAVLPLLNDLRAVRGEALLTETKLFTPNLAPAHRIADRHAAAAIDPQQFLVIIHKLRQMYQYAAAGVIRNVKREENIAYLYKIFARLRKLTDGTARQPLWDISLALVEGLEHEAIESSATVKNLLRQLDKEIKVLAEQGVAALNKFTNDELIKNLLYYVAQASRQGKYIDRIKQAYNLDAALPKRDVGEHQQQAMAPDLEAIRSVVDALKDELDAIKNALDISLSDRDSADIASALPIIKRVADTMAVLGIGDLRKQVLAQGELLESVADREEIPADVLMQVADQIIEIESSLDSMAAGSGRYGATPTPGLTALDQAQASVLRESRNGLEQAKDAIIEYIASQWNRDHLANVPKHLRDISGGLDMIPLRKPSAILRSCANFIESELLQKAITPEWSTLDTLADAIASVEYYLERLTGDREEEDELLLSVAEDSVEALGYPIGVHLRSSAATKPAVQADASSVLGKFAPVEEVELALPEDAAEERGAPARAESTQAEAPPEEITADAESAEDVQEITLEADADDHDRSEMELAEDYALVPVEESQENSEPESAAAENDEDDLIDEEILEIFVEEAQEVLEAINEYFPRWADNFEDEEALAEFRRAFHTLKGSGRMVNANDIGELAWAVENMLNRIIDNTVEPNDGHARLIQRVIPLLPDMVKAFEHRKPNPHPQKTAELSSWAEGLSRGEQPAGLFAEEGDSSVALEDAPLAITERDSNATAAEPVALEAEEHEEDDAPDTLLWDIFSSEAVTHLEVVEEYIAEMDASAPLFTPPSDQMQRALHTLKGSAHMADVKPIAELVAPLERFVKELRVYQVNIDSDILQLMKDGVEYIQVVLGQIDRQEELEIPRLAQYLARVAELKERSVAPLIRQKEALEENAKHSVDPELLSIFMAEEMKLLLDVDELIIGWRANEFDPREAEPVIAELATLERGSEHANLPPMASLSRQLREVYEVALRNQIEKDDDFYRVLLDGHAELLDMVDAVAVGQNLHPISDDVQNRLTALVGGRHERTNEVPRDASAADKSAPETQHGDDEELTLSIEDLPVGDEVELVADGSFELEEASAADESDDITIDIDWNVSEDELQTLAPVERGSHADSEPNQSTDEQTEPGAAQALERETGEKPEESLSDEDSNQHVVAEEDNSQDVEEVDLEVFEIFIEEAEELLEEIDESVHDWEEDWSDTSHVEALKRALHTLKGGARLAGLMGLGELAHEFESFLIAKGENVEVDQPFFDVVHEYQDKLISGTEKVKGRVAGHVPDGLEDVMRASENFDDELLQQPADAAVEAAEPFESERAEDPEDAPAIAPVAKSEAAEKTASADILPFAPKPKTPAKAASGGTGAATAGAPAREFSGAKPGGGAAAPARRPTPQEVIKVSAELLEELVNLAGETSISRGRLEEQNTELNFAIEEMESTVHRLQEQLRRLDIETEAQMIFRQEQMEVAEEFDPLEMDRYSQLQQLSRSLMESASDLMDLTTTLSEKTRGTETLLLQQSRINTDLQEGLMRSRMVPFSRMVPRLRRIVRQISTELDKQVSFELNNVEGELDRSVLERMVAPLEHMLRNAVDHGIESPHERRAAGKPESGTIALSLGREGGDIIMRLSDDGRGLNLARIREKAVERGLMAEGAQLSDQDIMQFILHAGFSTAEQVTQISGRGVGMDVVHSEIKQLGGSMFIDSRQGEGTEFIIRLPFTVSVNRALMIQLGDDNYAIPLNSIEGIVRVSPFELEHYYQDEDARFEYAGEQYRVRYLGNMLDRDALPRLDGQVLPLPVVLVRSAEHAVAIQVDKLMGSREIVVKSLGPQFATVEGLSGATVMGDGSVVVILDPNAIIRKEMALLGRMKPLEIAPVAEPKPESRTQIVLVVDDSVTVRKVTSRFLEREGYEVMTAKDGADALLTLQDHLPDIMLLDIEMPRMDGFEVAKNVRSSSRLKDLPIIMITSRTGEKHRERAFGLGVNKYLGKPYQEEVLLSNIHELIGAPVEH
ncbi:response regulator [Proteobacteria bacterium 005FR1]|nr:response regulator [Proteobacteria bacterium 005FR1]